MILVENSLGKKTDPAAKEWLADRKEVSISYEWFECERGRMKKTASDGTEFGIAIPGGVQAGDILYLNEQNVYVVELVPTRLIAILVHSPSEAARVGFELGNRHLSLAITDTQIRVPYDEPTYLYLKKLGFEVQDVTEAFDGFIQCKAHGHSHGQSGQEAHEHHHDHEHPHDHSHE